MILCHHVFISACEVNLRGSGEIQSPEAKHTHLICTLQDGKKDIEEGLISLHIYELIYHMSFKDRDSRLIQNELFFYHIFSIPSGKHTFSLGLEN